MDTQTLLNTVYRLENTEILNFSKHINLFRLMNPFQYINKIFCTLLFFATGNKSYSQREIHPLEPMFTYDYALKLYNNLDIMSSTNQYEYWCIENFRASVGIKSIEELKARSENFLAVIGRNYSHTEKCIHFFNPKTGYIKESIFFKIDNKREIIDTISIKKYHIHTDSINTSISIEQTIKDGKKKYFTNYQFENETKLLVQIIKDSTEITFKYNSKCSLSVHEILINNNKLKQTVYNDNIEPFSVQNMFKNSKIHIEKDKKSLPALNINTNSISTKEFGNTKYYSIQNTFNSKHIFYSWTTDDPNKAVRRLDGFLVFDKSNKLEEFHYELSDYDPQSLKLNVRKWGELHSFYRVLKRKNQNNWKSDFLLSFRTQESYDIEYLKRYKDQGYHKSQGHYKIKNNVFYYRKEPFLIYKYN